MSLLPGKSQFGLMPRLALVLALPLSAPLMAGAQNPTPAQQEETTPAQSNLTTGDGAANLLMQLNLKPEQIEQMKEIRRQSVPEVQTLKQRRQEARRALDKALYSNALDEAAIDQRTRELAEAQAALVRHEAQTQLRIRRVLTPEQLQMFRDLRQQAQRQQRIERRLERRGNQQALPRDRINRRLEQRPDSSTDKPGEARPNAITDKPRDAHPNAPAERMRDSRPFAFPRQRRRRP